MSEDKIFDIAIRVKIWMNKFEDNEWVQMCGNQWLRKLMDRI